MQKSLQDYDFLPVIMDADRVFCPKAPWKYPYPAVQHGGDFILLKEKSALIPKMSRS